MTNRVSNNQLDALLEFLAEHPNIAKGVGLGPRSKETIESAWNDLALRLNAFGSGCSKSGERWKKYWFDIKHKTKTRLTKRRREALATGGGPSSHEEWSETDKKIMAIIGEQAIFGDIEHRVPVFDSPLEQVGSLEVIQDDNYTNSNDNVEVIIIPKETLEMNPTDTLSDAPAKGDTGSNVTRPSREGTSPIQRPVAERRRLRRTPHSTVPSRIDPQWVMELERSRVEIERSRAESERVRAEAENTIAKAAIIMAEAFKGLVDLMRQQNYNADRR